MIFGPLQTIRSFRRSRSAEFCTPGRKSALLIGSAALLSSIASGQVPTTTALPYLLTDQAGQIRVTTTTPLAPVPPAVGQSQFGSLLGGGFSVLLTTPTASAAAAAAQAAIHKLVLMKNANFATKAVQEWNFDAMQADARLQTKLASTGCSNSEFSAERLNKGLITSIRFNHKLTAGDSPVCMLPEEQQAEEAEEQLQALTEAEDASQEAIEAAEEAAEAAEAAAEAAETAAEAALDGIDVLEGLLDALSLF